MEPIIVIPHWSKKLPTSIQKYIRLSQTEMAKDIDVGTEKIYNFPNYPQIKAEVSRFAVDLNRKRNEIKIKKGVIIRETWYAKKVLKKEIPAKEIERRLRKYYDPFFEKLRQAIKNSPKPFVLSGHSMSSVAGPGTKKEYRPRLDISLATDYGKTCSKKIIKIFLEEFRAQGFWTVEHLPYPGKKAEILHFSKRLGAEALQVEVNKKVYMNEKTFSLYPKKIKQINQILSTCLEKIEKI